MWLKTNHCFTKRNNNGTVVQLFERMSVFVSVVRGFIMAVPQTLMGFHQGLFSNWFHNWGQSYNLTFCLVVCFRRQEAVCWDAEQTTDRGGCLPPLRTLWSHRGVHGPTRSWRKQQRWEPLYSCQRHLGHWQRSVCECLCSWGLWINVTHTSDVGQIAFSFNYKHLHTVLFDVLIICRQWHKR